MRPSGFVAAALCVAALLIPTPGSADPITPGTYQLHNHPDGSAATPYYGLRLDFLLGQGVYTFDFDDTANGAAMYMDWNGSSLHIYGTAWGGKDGGSSYVNPSLWSIDFLYTGVTLASGDTGGFADLIVLPNANSKTSGSTGTITNGTDLFTLFDYSGRFGYTFRFGDENSGNGHRGFDGLSGWGWLNYCEGECAYTDTHLAASDWIFTAERREIPEPGAIALLLTAGGLGGLRRWARRTR